MDTIQKKGEDLSKTKLYELLTYVQSIRLLNKLSEYIHLQYRLTPKQKTANPDITLLKYLLDCLQNNKTKSYLSWTIISEMVFKKSLNTKDKNSAMFRLTKYTENFLVQNEVNQDKTLRLWLLWKGLQHKENKEYDTLSLQLNNHIEIELLDCQSHLNQFIAFDFFMRQYQEDCIKTEQPPIDNLSNTAYAMTLLKEQTNAFFDAEMSSRQTILEENIILEEKFPENKMTFKQLLNILNTLPHDTTSSQFIAYIKPYLEHKKVVKEKKATILSSALNALYLMAISGNTRPFYENWDYIIKKAFKEKILYNNDILPLQHYLNFLSYAMIKGEKLGLVAVIKFSKDLSKKDCAIGEIFGEIHLKFVQKNYADVLLIISDNKAIYRNSQFLKIRTYSFKIRTLFELYVQGNYAKERNRLDNAIKNFKDYINKHKDMKVAYTRNKAFISVVENLKNYRKLEKLKELEQIVNQQDIPFRIWINEKIDEKFYWIKQKNETEA